MRTHFLINLANATPHLIHLIWTRAHTHTELHSVPSYWWTHTLCFFLGETIASLENALVKSIHSYPTRVGQLQIRSETVQKHSASV
eukprot:c34032_g1_i1 orf=2-256(-)